MLSGAVNPRTVAERLAEAVKAAVSNGAQVIQISLEFSSRAIQRFDVLRDAVANAAEVGVRTVLPAGNSGLIETSGIFDSPGVVPVVMTDLKGVPVGGSTLGRAAAQRGLMSVGVELPGADSRGGFATRSGSSFAAALVTGAFALLSGVIREKSSEQIWEAILSRRNNCVYSSLLIPRMLDVETAFALLT